ncbi:MAG: chromosomal replication initiator protein DnaA [Phycisphaerales bacterium]|nr:chromosomal replication initiator protein DnaA [Phycisphaerales bacterium]
MTNPDRKVWEGVLAHLRRHHPALYRKWFEDELEPLAVAGGTLPVRTSSPVHAAYLAHNCLEQFNDALRAVTGALLTVRFLQPGEHAEPPARVVMKPTRAPSAPASRDETLAVNPDFGFETFVVGPTNRLAHAAAQAVADMPGTSYNPLFIHGDVGLGKTHLLQAICLAITDRQPDVKVCYLSCEGFVSQFMEAVQGGQMSEFRHRFRDVDVLVVDDIQTLGPRDRSQEEFFHTFNSLYQAQKQIVLSSDAPPELIPDLQKRLVSRFQWGLVTQIETPCFETRAAIVKSKAKLRGILLHDDVAAHIASVHSSNIRELEGAIGTLQINAEVRGVPIDLALAREVIGPAPAHEASRHATIQTIIDAVTGFYGVRLSDLQSKRRARSVTIPRQVCMFLARRCTRHSLEEIGGYFGGRDHTTVMHAVSTIESRAEADPEFKADLVVLEERVKPALRSA